jgi:hypothetical protein
MTTAERLLKIDEGVEKTKALNTELEQTLYGTDTGGKSFYDEFWDNMQNNGNRTDYSYAFGSHWNNTTLKPKYDIKPLNANACFRQCQVSDLEKQFTDCGIVLDTSKTRNFGLFFGQSTCTVIPPIDYSSITESPVPQMFSGCNQLVTLRKLKVREDLSYNTNLFQICYELVDLVIDGTIGGNGFNLQWSTKLSKASITSIINALSSTTSGLTVTLSQTAVNNAFTTDEWNALANTKTNWTISLV